MTNFKRPMLAASLLRPNQEHTDEVILAAMKKLKYPVLTTLKKDGIRAIKLSTLVSRTLKYIPNHSIRDRAIVLPAGLDCELWNPNMTYDCVESVVMSRAHKLSDSIQFHIIDWFGDTGYGDRLRRIGGLEIEGIVKPIARLANDAEELMLIFLEAEEQHGEGICFRTPNSPYKMGRSTLKEQYLIKLARYVRQEVKIVGFLEQMENGNESNYNAVGKMDRSSCQDNLLGKDTLGAFLVRDKNGLDFKVGTGVGLTDALRKEIWNNKAKWIDKQITIKHKPHGMKIKPRSPVFIGLREEGY